MAYIMKEFSLNVDLSFEKSDSKSKPGLSILKDSTFEAFSMLFTTKYEHTMKKPAQVAFEFITKFINTLHLVSLVLHPSIAISN